MVIDARTSNPMVSRGRRDRRVLAIVGALSGDAAGSTGRRRARRRPQVTRWPDGCRAWRGRPSPGGGRDEDLLEGVEFLETLSAADGHAVSGSRATTMGIPVSSCSRASSPCRRAPPPVRTMPCSMMSAASSGGVLSRVTLTASMMADTGSSMALRISSVETTTVFGSPVTRSRPRISACNSSSSGKAEPSAILISSEVRSPRARLYSFLMKEMMASSSSSPPIRTDWLVTIPPREMTATSVVPPRCRPPCCRSARGRKTGADGGGHRLLDDVRLPGAGVLGRLHHGPLLHTGDPRRHADDHPRLGEPALVDPLDEIAEHLLADLEVGDDAVLQRPDGLDVARVSGRSSAWPRPPPPADGRPSRSRPPPKARSR